MVIKNVKVHSVEIKSEEGWKSAIKLDGEEITVSGLALFMDAEGNTRLTLNFP
jgi:hypothetical protein